MQCNNITSTMVQRLLMIGTTVIELQCSFV